MSGSSEDSLLGIPGLSHVRFVGSGGAASVYVAWQASLERWVAVKVIRGAGPDVERRFERERRAMGRLGEHPGILSVHDTGLTVRGEPYLVLPYMGRGSLQTMMDTNGPIDWSAAVALISRVCVAVDFAHRQGIVHRDLKPGNILLSDEGEPVVADFGIARFVSGGDATSRSSVMTFTPAYSPPEAFTNEPLTPATDVYALAATLYGLVAGHAPFTTGQDDDNLLALLRRIGEDPLPDLRPQVPEAIWSVLTRALAKDPAERPQSARDLAEALRSASDAAAAAAAGPSEDVNETKTMVGPNRAPVHSPLPAASAVSTPADETQRRRKPWVFALVALLLAGAGGLAAIALSSGGGTDDSADEATTATSEATEASDDGATSEATEATDGGATSEATEASHDGATSEATEDGATSEATDGNDGQEPTATASEEPTDGGGGTGGELDTANGTGATAFQTAAQGDPVAADEGLEPVLITMLNIEDDPNGSFPDSREGFAAAVQLINTQLGGINGRPVVFEPCVHSFDADAASTCAEQVLGADPVLNVNGIEFFTPDLYPALSAAGVPVVETFPLFVDDYDTAGVTSISGGCVSAFPGGARMIAEVAGHDRAAIIYSNSPEELACYTDTQERFYNYYKETFEGTAGTFDFVGVLDNPGDPSDTDAIIEQVADFLEGAESPAVYLGGDGHRRRGIQAADCNEILDGLLAAGVEAQIYSAASCVSEAVQSDPASGGVIFEFQGYIMTRPDLYDEFVAWELEFRETAIDAFGPEIPTTNLMRVAFSAGILVWEVLTALDAAGTDLHDGAAVTAAFRALSNQHLVGFPPIDCAGNVAEYESICKRTTTFATWTGAGWDLAPLDGEYLDVTDLLVAVEESSPRGG